MAGYQSKLDAALRQRQIHEKEIQVEFSEMKNSLAKEERALQKLHQEMEKALHALYENQSKGMEMNEIDLYYQFIGRQCREADDRQMAIKRLAAECETKQQALIHAMQEKKIVEVIEEKRKDTYTKEMNKKEQRLLDEIGR